MTSDFDVVTGAFSYSGRAIAARLLESGRRVRTLTRHADPTGELAGRVEAVPFRFDDPAALANSLRGASTLYNTYWIRFEHGGSTFARAIENTGRLLTAAQEAGVRRFVHLSVTNASSSQLPYFRGKAQLERDVAAAGIPYAIVRPTLVFGPEDILVNNIAWILRRTPLFVVPGSGGYRVQPVSVSDTAAIAVDAAGAVDDITVDAAGPEAYSFRELVRLLAAAVGSRARIVRAPPPAALALAGTLGRLRRDVVLTREELDGLMAGLLVSGQRPRGRESFRAWVEASAHGLGRTYRSELRRNYAGAPL